jgi:hypothetical protein
MKNSIIGLFCFESGCNVLNAYVILPVLAQGRIRRKIATRVHSLAQFGGSDGLPSLKLSVHELHWADMARSISTWLVHFWAFQSMLSAKAIRSGQRRKQRVKQRIV